MLESSIVFEGSTEITINGEPVIATCGPIRTEPQDEFERGLVRRRKIIGPASKMPATHGAVVDIDGEEWVVEQTSFFGPDVIVTFVGYLK